MGLFGKKEEKNEAHLPELPPLPELPTLPDFSPKKEEIHQLPTLPRSTIAQKFSQNMIKEAVTGKESDIEEEIDEFEDEDQRTMIPPFQKFPVAKVSPIPEEFQKPAAIVRSNEPVFIRLDKFEDSLKLFEKTKEKVEEIEKMLEKINRIREDEEKELSYWGEEVKSIKSQLQRIDKEIFSKIE